MDGSVVMRLLLSDGTPIDADPLALLQSKTVNVYIYLKECLIKWLDEWLWLIINDCTKDKWQQMTDGAGVLSERQLA